MLFIYLEGSTRAQQLLQCGLKTFIAPITHLMQDTIVVIMVLGSLIAPIVKTLLSPALLVRLYILAVLN